MPNHIIYRVNGFGIQMTARRKWTAYRWQRNRHGKLAVIDEIPITWTRDTEPRGGKVFQKIYFPENKVQEGKLLAHFYSAHPFFAAIAVAKNYQARPLELDAFVDIFEVRSTRKMLSHRTIEVEVVRQNVH